MKYILYIDWAFLYPIYVCLFLISLLTMLFMIVCVVVYSGGFDSFEALHTGMLWLLLFVIVIDR